MAAALGYVVDGVRYVLGWNVYSTTTKVMNSLEQRIQKSDVVQGICSEKGWQSPAINLNHANRPQLYNLIAQCLQGVANYQAYSALSAEQKNAFREDVAEQIANKMVASIKKVDVIGGISGYLKKKVDYVIVPLSQLPDAEVKSAVASAAVEAGISLEKVAAVVSEGEVLPAEDVAAAALPALEDAAPDAALPALEGEAPAAPEAAASVSEDGATIIEEELSNSAERSDSSTTQDL